MTQTINTIIIGAGLTGLTIAHKIKRRSPEKKLLVLEKTKDAGGVIRTHTEKGFISEIGPHGFLDNCEESRTLLQESGLDAESVKAPLIDFVRYVYLNGDLRLIPQSPLKIMKAPLIPWSAKLRVLADIWKPPLSGEPTVERWVKHRFGNALVPFADAVFTGTYAGDISKLAIDGVMPGVRKLEKEHGSVIKGLLRKLKTAKKEGKKRPSMPAMTSFPKGMVRLPEKLAEILTEGDDILYNCGVNTIQKTDTGWRVTSEVGEFTSTNLVLAVPTNAALKLLGNIDKSMPLTHIPVIQLATISFGFDSPNTLPPGFGYLTPEQENRFSLGSLFSSNMFPGRAPQGQILFETLVGGRRHPEKLDLDDNTLIKKSLEDVREILKLTGDPIYASVTRSWGGIPQLEAGYPALLEWRNQLVEQNSTLHVCGFGWEGIGLNDMIKSATKVANSIITSDQSQNEEPPVKPVYF
jgi:protoporphyrinogen/coproporphyrinogen III oxidase